MLTVRKLCPVFVAGLLCAACSPAGESAAESFNPSGLHQFQLTELVEIGRDESEGPVVHQVTDATFLGGDEIAIASDIGEILVFGTQGGFRRSLGRQGEGPGEFRFIQHIVRLADGRMLAWDPALDRITVLQSDGRLNYVCTPEWARSLQAGVEFVGAFPNGRFVLAQMSNRPPDGGVEGFYRDTIPFHLFDRSGAIVRTLGRFVRPPRFYTPQNGYQRYLFSSTMQSEIVGDAVVVGETNTIAFQRFDSAGSARDSVDLERVPRRVTEPDIEAGWRAWEEQMVMQLGQMTAQLAAVRGEGAAAAMQRQAEETIAREREKVEPAEYLPAFKSIIVGSDGRIWLEDYLHPTEDITRWTLMDEGFVPLGRIDLPHGERLLAAGPRSLIVLRKDDLDVESVVVYGGEWPAAEG